MQSPDDGAMHLALTLPVYAPLEPPYSNRIARPIVKQMLLALQFLHEECGLVHNGKLKFALAVHNADGLVL